MHGLRKPMADTELDARRLCKPDKHATIFATCAGFRARSRLACNAIHGRRGIGRGVPCPAFELAVGVIRVVALPMAPVRAGGRYPRGSMVPAAVPMCRRRPRGD